MFTGRIAFPCVLALCACTPVPSQPLPSLPNPLDRAGLARNVAEDSGAAALSFLSWAAIVRVFTENSGDLDATGTPENAATGFATHASAATSACAAATAVHPPGSAEVDVAFGSDCVLADGVHVAGRLHVFVVDHTRDVLGLEFLGRVLRIVNVDIVVDGAHVGGEVDVTSNGASGVENADGRPFSFLSFESFGVDRQSALHADVGVRLFPEVTLVGTGPTFSPAAIAGRFCRIDGRSFAVDQLTRDASSCVPSAGVLTEGIGYFCAGGGEDVLRALVTVTIPLNATGDVAAAIDVTGEPSTLVTVKAPTLGACVRP